MDPLSITASTIAIGSLVNGVLKAGKVLRGVDDSALALLNELSDLEFVMHDVRHVFEEIQQQDSMQNLPTSSLTQSLAQAQRHLEELERIVQYDIVSPNSTEDAPKFNRRAWLRNRERIRRLKDQLRDTRMNIFTTLGMLGYCTGHSVQISLKEMRTELRAIQEAPATPMLMIQEGNRPRQIDGYPEPKLLADSSTQAKLLMDSSTPSTKLLAPPPNTSPKLLGGPSNPTTPPAFDCGHEFRPLSWENIPPPATYHSFEVRLVRAAGFKCDARCACRCHNHSRIRTPAVLEQMVGSLFVGYSNIPLISRGCNDRFCRRESSVAVSAVYTFPTWLCQRQLRIFADKPEFLVRISPVRSGKAAIFLYAKKNYVPGLKRLLANGQASILDVNELGQNVLWHAVAFGALDAVAFLMRISADARQVSQKGWSALHEAWMCQLICKDSPFQRFFGDRGDLEIFGFSKLHHAVLGLHGQDVETALQYWQAEDIDVRDDTGYTPLAWAARRNDQKTIELLLAQGADMNLPQPNSFTPLTLTGNLCEAFKHLELPGANLFMKDRWGNTLLHILAKRVGGFTPKCFRCLDNIIKAGVDVNARNMYQLTPLHFACHYSSPAVVEYLLRNGADIEARSRFGTTPLLTSARFNYTRMTLILLSHKANVHASTYTGQNILHYAAMYGDRAFLIALAEWRLPAYLLRWKDKLGATPLNLMEQRIKRPWFRSFLDVAQAWPGPNSAVKKPPCLLCHKQAWQKAWKSLVESLAAGPEPHSSMLMASSTIETMKAIDSPKPKVARAVHSPKWTLLSDASVDAIPFMHLSNASLTNALYLVLVWWFLCWAWEGKPQRRRTVCSGKAR